MTRETRPWAGDENMQKAAEEAKPWADDFLRGLSAEEFAGVAKLFAFWRANIAAGHKNVYRMLQEAMKAVASDKKQE